MGPDLPGIRPADAGPTAAAVVGALRARRFRYAHESDLQAGLERVLGAAFGHFVRREAPLGAGDRPDFLVGAVVVEVKVGGGLGPLLRQLQRYAQHESVEAIVAVVGLHRLKRLPAALNGKPVHVVHAPPGGGL